MLWLLYWVISAFFVQKTKTSEGFWARLLHFVPTGLGLFLIFHQDLASDLALGFFSRDVVWSFAGFVLTFVGLIYSVWARTHLGRNWSGTITVKEGHRLIRTGPYRLSRHPIYTGFLLAVLGSALAARTYEALLGFMIILVAYVVKMRREEAFLIREFGQEYEAFRQEVKALIPFIF